MNSIFRLGLFALCATLAPAAFADISIGHVLPLTGPQAATARELNIGAKVYIDQVNAAGGVAGHKINYLVRDDAGLPAQTLVRANELISRDKVFGLLEGSSPASVLELVSSGSLRQHSVAMVGVANGIGSPVGLADARKSGLVEITPPQDYVAPLLNEFRAALRQYGPAGEPYSSVALQGYIAAKVAVGAVRLLGPNPTRAEYYGVLQNMVPDVSKRLVISAGLPQETAARASGL